MSMWPRGWASLLFLAAFAGAAAGACTPDTKTWSTNGETICEQNVKALYAADGAESPVADGFDCSLFDLSWARMMGLCSFPTVPGTELKIVFAGMGCSTLMGTTPATDYAATVCATTCGLADCPRPPAAAPSRPPPPGGDETAAWFLPLDFCGYTPGDIPGDNLITEDMIDDFDDAFKVARGMCEHYGCGHLAYKQDLEDEDLWWAAEPSRTDLCGNYGYMRSSDRRYPRPERPFSYCDGKFLSGNKGDPGGVICVQCTTTPPDECVDDEAASQFPPPPVPLPPPPPPPSPSPPDGGWTVIGVNVGCTGTFKIEIVYDYPTLDDPKTQCFDKGEEQGAAVPGGAIEYYGTPTPVEGTGVSMHLCVVFVQCGDLTRDEPIRPTAGDQSTPGCVVSANCLNFEFTGGWTTYAIGYFLPPPSPGGLAPPPPPSAAPECDPSETVVKVYSDATCTQKVAEFDFDARVNLGECHVTAEVDGVGTLFAKAECYGARPSKRHAREYAPRRRPPRAAHPLRIYLSHARVPML